MTRTEKTYYAVGGLYMLWGWFMAPIYPLFLLSRGLDLFQVNLVLATFLFCTFLFEVPTGAIADTFGRKFSFLLSCVVRCFAFGLYFFAESFADCLIAEVIDALGATLATGALDAWAVDGMRAEGDRRPTDRFFSRAQMLARTLMIFGGVASGYIAEVDIAYPWLVGCFGFYLTGVVGYFTMHEPPRVESIETPSRSIVGTMRAGWQTVRQSPILLSLCALSAILVFAAVPPHMLWQARLQEISGEGFRLIGWVWALINLVAVLASWVLPWLQARSSREVVLFAATIWRAGMLALVAVATSFHPAVLGILMQEVSFGLSEPIFLSWVNEHAEAEHRATVMSVRSMFGTLGGAVGLVLLGLVARYHGIAAVWLTSAVIFACVAPLFLLLRRTPVAAASRA